MSLDVRSRQLFYQNGFTYLFKREKGQCYKETSIASLPVVIVYSTLGIPDFSAHSNCCSLTFRSQSVLGDCVVCLQLFCCHLLVPFDYGVLAHPQEKRKRLRARAVSVYPSPHMEIRVACTLGIVIGVFTACWVLVMTALFCCP